MTERTGSSPSLADMEWLRGLAIDARSPELVSAIDSLKRKYAATSSDAAPDKSRPSAVMVEAAELAGQQYRYKQDDGWSDWISLPNTVEPLQQDNLQYRFVYAGPSMAADAFKETWDQSELARTGLPCGYVFQFAARRWRHNKRGSSYAEISRATSQSAIPIVEGETVVVYIADVDGSMHVRKEAEFEDGRFQEIAPSVPSSPYVQGSITK